MKKKSLIIILSSVVAVLLVGYVLSRYTSWPLDLRNTDGDIGKVEKFSSEMDGEKITNMEELLQADSTYKDGIVAAYVVMQARASQFATLVELSNMAADDIDALADVLKDMNKGSEMISNVNEQLALAGNDLEAALNGEKRPDLAQNTINASLAYTTLQKQNTLANRFIEATDKYLEDNKGNDQLKLVRDQWVDYQKMTAALEDNAETVKELENKGYLLSEEEAKAALSSYEEAAQEVMSLNSILCVCMNLNNSLGIRVKNGEILGIRVKNGENLGVRVKNGEFLGVRVKNEENLGVRVKNEENLGVRVKNEENLGVRVKNEENLGVRVKNEENLGVRVKNEENLGVRVKNGENLGVRVKNGENLGVRVKSAETLELLNMPMVNAIFNSVVIRSEAAAELNKNIKLASQINLIIQQTAVGYKATLNLI